MQTPIQPNGNEVCQQQPVPQPQQPPQPQPKRRRRSGRAGRFFRGYLMIVGPLPTLNVLIQLLVLLFVEIGMWMPPQPML